MVRTQYTEKLSQGYGYDVHIPVAETMNGYTGDAFFYMLHAPHVNETYESLIIGLNRRHNLQSLVSTNRLQRQISEVQQQGAETR
jgi:hypothetical protein